MPTGTNAKEIILWFGPGYIIPLTPQMFFKINVFKNFAVFPEIFSTALVPLLLQAIYF